MHRRTRIVATLGPATDRPGVLEAMLVAGLDVARINFSHGEADEHLRRVARLRELSGDRSRTLAVLADLPGPKLRALVCKPIELERGQVVAVACSKRAKAQIDVTEPELIAEVRPGQRLLLDDGRLVLRAEKADGDRLLARVETGGILLPNKGINVPDSALAIPALTDRDRQALAVAAQARVDWVALSFVRNASAADELRRELERHNLRVPILAKIEKPEALANAAGIIESFDGIMVARGDLGVEISVERVPQIQKKLIRLARSAGKPVITATDMLDSMRTNPRPTRAEASDVANAIYDGTDAVMLSGETAVGAYPVQAVAYMERIARTVDVDLMEEPRELEAVSNQVDDEMAYAACKLARELKAHTIVAPTYSGRTARLVARQRPPASIIAPASDEAVVRQLALTWGVTPVYFDPLTVGDDRLEAAMRAAFQAGALIPGQLAVVLAGHPIEGGQRVPTIRVVRIGDNGQSWAP
ncbi:MAG: pyruvate kinase [Gemmatales bacterium]|nr:MAG: pyruvate kinase [Gemmatales bacterium]